MPRRTLFSAVVVGAALGLVTADRTLAGEQYNAGMKVISSDATDARLVQLGLNKSVVIELSRDIKKVLIAGGQGGQSAGQHPTPVNVVVLSRRRVSIIGAALGGTNVYFYDADDRQISALVVYVSNIPQLYPDELENSNIGGNLVRVDRGGNQDGFGGVKVQYLFCNGAGCGIAPPEEEPANTTHSDITISGGATPVVPVGR